MTYELTPSDMINNILTGVTLFAPLKRIIRDRADKGTAKPDFVILQSDSQDGRFRSSGKTKPIFRSTGIRKGHHCGSSGGVDKAFKSRPRMGHGLMEKWGKAWPILAFSAALVHQVKRFSLPQPILGA